MIRQRVRNHGLTLMELTFALVAMSFLGLAISSLMVGAGNAWETRDTFVDHNQSMRGISVRLSQWVHQSQRVIKVDTVGPYTDILIWANDENFPDEVNIGELEVITLDSRTGVLMLHRAELSASQLADVRFNTPIDPAILATSGFSAVLRNAQNVSHYELASNVASLKATLGATNGNAEGSFVEFQVTFDLPDGYTDQTVLIAAASRAPDNDIEFTTEDN